MQDDIFLPHKIVDLFISFMIKNMMLCIGFENCFKILKISISVTYVYISVNYALLI